MSQSLDQRICAELLPVLDQLSTIASSCEKVSFVMGYESFWLNWEGLLKQDISASQFAACDAWTYRINEPGAYDIMSSFCQEQFYRKVSGLRQLAQSASNKLTNTGTLVLFNPNSGQLTECVGAYSEEKGTVNVSALGTAISSQCPDCRFVVCELSGGPIPDPTEWSAQCCEEVKLQLLQILDKLKAI